MKKIVILLLLFISATIASAQEFNPYKLFTDNEVIVNTTGSSFINILATKYNTMIPVRHHIAFKYNKFDEAVEIDNFYNYLDNNYQAKGFSIEDAMSLIYFFIRDNQIGGNSLSHKGNHFVVNDNGTLYVIMLGWSDIQHKWVMCAIQKKIKINYFL